MVRYRYSHARRDKLRPHLFRPPMTELEMRFQIWTGTQFRPHGLVWMKRQEALAWCHANLRRTHPSHPRAMTWTWDCARGLLAIADDADAMAFKLRWC